MATQKSILSLSYDSKNLRINQLIETIFKDVSKDDIKVGLIDPVLGYVVEVGICEANEYAKNNPGTSFIFRDANNSIQYLNINEVNALKPEDLVSITDICTGIQTRKECGKGPPRIHFFGGGGVGAKANAIVGVDGAILAVDVISGGFGYRYPPLVKAIDDCQYGSGAVLVSQLGEVAETLETFEDEDDFEDYEICPETTVGYSRNYGSNGEDLGPWEPQTYTNVDQDPIRKEIDAYQKSLLKINNPFWTTKSVPPKSITSVGKKYSIPYVVTDFRWNDFMNSYAISPVPPSNVKGSDEAGKLFVFDWDVNFPHDGEYTFRGLCDNVSKLYVDNIVLFDLGSFNDAVSPIKKQLKAGSHSVRIDLLNLPILEPEKKLRKKPNKIRKRGFETITTTIEPGVYLDLTGYRANEEVKCVFRTLFSPGGPKINIPEVGIFENVEVGDGMASVISPEKSIRYNSDIRGEVFLKGGRLYGPITIVPDPQYKESELFIGMVVGATNEGEELDQNIAFANFERLGPYYYAMRTLTGRGAEGEGGGPNVKLGRESLNAFAKIDVKEGIDSEGNSLIRRDGFGFIEQVVQFTLIISDSRSFFRRITQPITTSSTIRTSTYADVEEPKFEIVGNATIDVPKTSIPSTIRNENVFNTVDYISKANRTLWRTNPTASLTSGLLDRYGVCPFDTSSAEAQVESYAGIHTIIWNNVKFPVTGDYRIEIAVDDNVSLYIGDTLIRKEGFYAPGKRNPDLNEIYSFKEGNYTIRAELEQIEVGPIAIRNPMSLAINIETTFTTGEVISARSFNENPMGISVSIDAPPLPVPKEQPPVQTGRCPPSPIWSTRFPSLKEQWYPVRRTTGDPIKGTAWSKFMNRYAVSPVPPFDTDNTDSAGINFTNTWTVELPYPGFYGVRGTVDNSGRVLIDGKEISKLDSFGVENPKLEKVFLQKGTHEIVVEVFNTPIEGAFDIPIKIFSTRDWEVSVSRSESSLAQSGSNKDGVIYEGPDLASYIPGFLSPYFKNTLTPTEEIQGKTWIMTWRNVDFPEDGKYNLTVLADDLVIVRVDGVEVGRAKVFENEGTVLFNATKGKKTVQLELSNIRIENTGFKENPVITFVEIIKNSSGSKVTPLPWTTNPIGISVILIPPPCPKLIKGKGTISKVIVNDPGNGYACPPGKIRNPQTGECEDPPTQCPPDQIFDTKTGKCIDLCPPDKVYDPILKKCIKPPIDCPSGQVYDPVTQRCVEKEPSPGGSGVPGVPGVPGEPEVPGLVPGEPEVPGLVPGEPEVPGLVPGEPEVPGLVPGGPGAPEGPRGPGLVPGGSGGSGLVPGLVPGGSGGSGLVPGGSGLVPGLVPGGSGLVPGLVPGGSGLVPGLVPGAPGTPRLVPGAPGLVPGAPGLVPGAPGVPQIPINQYPVCLILDEVIIENSGINYNCGVDKLQIVPKNGVILDYICDSFGRISDVKILDNGTCFSEYPSITMITDTGVNASFRPVFRVVRDPIDPALTGENQKLIQVTDLVGIKKTGYIDGKPYYGAVFYENGIRYAGYYKTVGTLIRVYDTLQESITAEVTTPPNAIERFGTDINNNNLRLNIPQTPTNLI
jgi:hypothetical protein